MDLWISQGAAVRVPRDQSNEPTSWNTMMLTVSQFVLSFHVIVDSLKTQQQHNLFEKKQKKTLITISWPG